MIRRDYLIVGAGLGGASACEGIRAHDPKSSILLVGSEGFLPYPRLAAFKASLDQPALALSEEEPMVPAIPNRPLTLLPEAWYEHENIDLRLNTVVTELILERRLAVLDTGAAVEFRKACLAMGSRARRPPVLGIHLGNIFTVRTLRDALALQEAVADERQVIVIGGGCLAAEVAAFLPGRIRGEVTLLHRGKALWNRWLDTHTAEWLTAHYARHGVKTLMGETLNGFEGQTILKNVQTKSGLRIAAGVAILALGVDMNLALVAQTPLSYPHGTPVNEFLETDEKGIYAVGEIAAFPDRLYGGVRRVDQPEAIRLQGLTAGANLTGKKRQKFEWLPHRCARLFDLRLDLVGDFSHPPGQVELIGDRAENDFIVRYRRGGVLSGVVLCNQSQAQVEEVKTHLRERPKEVAHRQR